ncbi:hypothetical protein IAD21_00795 [Abditibacteriota bacterium]|nr:hypothetical protein IAD21_00795 [Abditibacteriota bacterium]
MAFTTRPFAVLSTLLLFCGVGNAQNSPGGTLLQFDFNSTNAWPQATASLMAAKPQSVAAIETQAVGTVDVANSTEPSGGLLLTAQTGTVRGHWLAIFGSGLLPVTNHETNPGKLTLAFNLSASAARPIKVVIESFDVHKKRTGGLETRIYPAAPDFYQRYALDLSNFKTQGDGKFQPDAPFVNFSFQLDGDEWQSVEKPEVRLDNVNYATPTYYVSPNGNDQNDGRTEKTAFADPQKAVELAQPGDIVVLMGGTYTRAATSSPDNGVVGFRRGGTPAAWVTLKNYPGQEPILTTTDSWNILTIGRGNKTTPSTEPALAYIEVRGLHLRGEGNVAREKYPDLMEKANPQTNANGLRVEGRYETQTMHHIRLADNVVEFVPCHGIFTYDTDWLTLENNVVRDNCWTSMWEGSGISMLGGRDFDGTRNVYKTLARGNQVSGNRCFVKSAYAKAFRNGNGILIDANNEKPEKSYGGRVLVQNNLSFNNGGVGIQMWGCHRLDIVNNTVYLNGASPEMNWGQMAVTFCDDIRMINNIVVAPPNRPLNTWYAPTESRVSNIVRLNNLYFGGKNPPLSGVADIIADPQFINPTLDPTTADFRLKPESPARAAGYSAPFVPIIDLQGQLRPSNRAPDQGAF